jgi:hypothetical protein
MHGSSSNHVVAQQGVVRTFSANAKFSSSSTAAHLSFMATCIVELFGLDEEAAYSHAFTVRLGPSCVCGLVNEKGGVCSNCAGHPIQPPHLHEFTACVLTWARR